MLPFFYALPLRARVFKGPGTQAVREQGRSSRGVIPMGKCMQNYCDPRAVRSSQEENARGGGGGEEDHTPEIDGPNARHRRTVRKRRNPLPNLFSRFLARSLATWCTFANPLPPLLSPTARLSATSWLSVVAFPTARSLPSFLPSFPPGDNCAYVKSIPSVWWCTACGVFSHARATLAFQDHHTT